MVVARGLCCRPSNQCGAGLQQGDASVVGLGTRDTCPHGLRQAVNWVVNVLKERLGKEDSYADSQW